MNYEAVIKKTANETVKAMTEKTSRQLNKIAEAAATKAANQAFESGRLQAEKRAKDCYQATERRLYAVTDLRERIKKNREKLEDLERYGLPGHSTDFVRFRKSGSTLDNEDIEEAMKIDLQAQIASDENMIAEIEEALESLKNDRYYLVISGRYFENMGDAAIAKKIAENDGETKPPDIRTIARNRTRLIRKIAVRLFGAAAV